MPGRKKVYVKENSFIARLAAQKLKTHSVAIVLGHTIYLYNTAAADFLNNTPWLLHELKHVEQYENLGFAKFIFLYLTESFRKGYYQNSLEIAARAAEKQMSLLEKYKIVC